jgi:predicted phage terminase large subunit-like protein
MKFTLINDALKWYADFLSEAEQRKETRVAMRELALRDLFFLLYYVLNRKDIGKQWLFDRCQEVQQNPNGYLDLWAREHYKSTIITFGKTIQDVLADPEITIGIFSLNRPLSKDFLQQIKFEFENNQVLKDLFPDVLYQDPRKEAPIWNLDDGLIVRRKGNPKEATIEAHGLIESMPTGKHFQIRLYDDVIDERNVTNPEMIAKAIKGWELSLNLGSQNPSKVYGFADISRIVGTKYHLNDPYAEIKKRGSAIERRYPGTLDGKPDGEPVLWSRDVMRAKRRDMGPYVFGCQILLDPKADEAQGFDESWLKYHSIKSDQWHTMNLYILCDPANEKKRDNDYTVIAILGTGKDHNIYLIDFLRDRLNLSERTKAMFEFHRKYMPIAVGYERYGKDSDIEHIEYVQELENYRFEITELGGSVPKRDRIRKLIPLFEQGRFYLPARLTYIDYQKRNHDLVREFIDEEFITFPVGSHDDMLDCFARIVDPDLGARYPLKSSASSEAVSLLNRNPVKHETYREVYA